MAKKNHKMNWNIIDVIRGGTPAEVYAMLDYLESEGHISPAGLEDEDGVFGDEIGEA